MAVMNRSLPSGMKKTIAKIAIIQNRMVNSFLLFMTKRLLNTENLFDFALRGNVTFEFDFSVDDDGRGCHDAIIQ